MQDWDWRHYSGIATVLGAVAISLYEQFGGPKVILVHDMVVIRDFCFSFAGIMFGHILGKQSEKGGSVEKAS